MAKGSITQKSSKSKQLINRVFNAIGSVKDIEKQWYCWNRSENCGCEFRPRQFRSVSAEPLSVTRGTLWFRGTPVAKHWPRVSHQDNPAWIPESNINWSEAGIVFQVCITSNNFLHSNHTNASYK